MKEKIFASNEEFFEILIKTIKRLEEGQKLIVEKKGNKLKCYCEKVKK
jgi:prephenate dehydrogenase